MRKRYLLIAPIAFLIIALFPVSCQKSEKAEQEKKPRKDKKEQVGAVDPYILDLRSSYAKYTGVILPRYKGAEGQTVTWPKDTLFLTESEAGEIKKGDFTIAVSWNTLEGVRAASMRQGLTDAVENYGLEIIAETDAQNDPAKQAADIESLISRGPDVIIAYPVILSDSADVYKKAVDAGIKLAFIGNNPQGLSLGADYIGIVAENNHDRGLTAANHVAELIGKYTKIALITLDSEYWNRKYTDELVRDTIKGRYPGIKILADEKFSSVEEAGDIAARALNEVAEIECIYTTNPYAAVAVASACEKAGRGDIKIVTTNINEQALINMAQGGNILATSADTTYLIGVDAVILACYGMLGKGGPAFAVSPVIGVTRDNIRDAWNLSKRLTIPEELEKALQDAGL
jgi:ribose transport system substrate-binding protein